LVYQELVGILSFKTLNIGSVINFNMIQAQKSKLQKISSKTAKGVFVNINNFFFLNHEIDTFINFVKLHSKTFEEVQTIIPITSLDQSSKHQGQQLHF
jgi:hypothetical protein